MTVPITTSTFTVIRAADDDADSGDPIVWTTVYEGLPGTTMFYSGSASAANGLRERVDCRIAFQPDLDIQNYDQVIDEQTGDHWRVAWSRRRVGFGLDHQLIGCYEITGVARGTKDL